MVRTPILTRFGGIPGLIQAGFGRKRPDLHTAFLQPERLPHFVIECPPAMRILDLIGSIPWGQFPERNLYRNWGQVTIPHAAFSAACLVKLNEGLVSMADLRQYLVEHPAFIWLLGFPLTPSARFSCGFDPSASLPTQRHLKQMLRDIPNTTMQFLLGESVRLLLSEFATLGFERRRMHLARHQTYPGMGEREQPQSLCQRPLQQRETACGRPGLQTRLQASPHPPGR